MELRGDYLLNFIRMLVEILRQRILKKNAVDTAIVDQIFQEGCGFNPDQFRQFPQIMKQMINLAAVNDENKKALAIVCLFLKNQDFYKQLCNELLVTLHWNLLHEETQNLLEEIFDIDPRLQMQDSSRRENLCHI
jgi:hypothetical protein